VLKESLTSLSKNLFSFKRFKLIFRNSNISYIKLYKPKNFKVYYLRTDSFPNTFLLTT
jgi:ribosomal protein S18 acetylase RimI-like enzyme